MYCYEALNIQSSNLDKLALLVRLDSQLEQHFNIKLQQKRRFSNWFKVQ